MVIRFIYALVVTACLFSLNAKAESKLIQNLPAISYVNFRSLDSINPRILSAQLRVPITAGAETKLPAVVIVHGSAGVDSRGGFYATALNDAGIATLEIDMWAARGWLGGSSGRPKGVPETLPDAYGALRFLSELPNIDPDRIGVMGFSWGGAVAMLTATAPYTAMYMAGGGPRFAAHIAHYPVCWIYNHIPGYEFNDFTGAPVLIQTGEFDAYDEPDTCPNLVRSLPASAQEFISVRIYRASHAWDRLQPAVTILDSYSHLGKGGEVEIIPNPGKAFQSRRNVLKFFRKAFETAH